MFPYNQIDIDFLSEMQLKWSKGEADLDNFNSLLTGTQYAWFYALSAAYLPRGSEVLDWGAGNGHASRYLSRHGCRVTGYDVGSDINIRGAATGDRSIGAGFSDPIRLPFSDDSFDATLSVGVLEHVRETGGNELASLQELLRVTRPNGRIICVHLPNSGSWIEALASKLNVDGHQYRFTARQVSHLFNAAGWSVELTGRYGFLPRNRVPNFLPGLVCNSITTVNIYNIVDHICSRLLPWFAQNHFVVARKSST